MLPDMNTIVERDRQFGNMSMESYGSICKWLHRLRIAFAGGSRLSQPDVLNMTCINMLSYGTMLQ